MKITGLMTRKPHILSKNASLLDAVQKMEQASCGILPIGEAKHVVGVVTDRDIIVRALAKGKDLITTKVIEVMTPKPLYCYEDENLQDVLVRMEQHNIRRILVKNRNELLTGILTFGDVVRRAPVKFSLASLFQNTNNLWQV